MSFFPIYVGKARLVHEGGTKEYFLYRVISQDKTLAYTVSTWGKIGHTSGHKIAHDFDANEYGKILTSKKKRGYKPVGHEIITHFDSYFGWAANRDFLDVYDLMMEHGLLPASMPKSELAGHKITQVIIDDDPNSPTNTNPNLGMF